MTGEAELAVLMNGVESARLSRTAVGRLGFAYRAAYISEPRAVPLSLSLPLTDRPFGHVQTLRWISSLLPDNPSVLQRWHNAHNVSDAFGLLSTSIGHDCAGAVQFCKPGQEGELAERASGTVILSDDVLADEVAAMTQDPSRWTDDDIEPYFSLGGYQNKLALHRIAGGWARPHGAIPTTHILKPRHVGMASAAVVEHLCAAAARRLGLDAVSTSVEIHASHPVVVVERYDRVLTAMGWERRHQEDVCQALGVDGHRKYEKEGGPGISVIGDTLRRYSSDPDQDVKKFAEALLWALLTVNRDAHARNYSLLHNAGETRLAPIYDLHSSLPFVAQGLGRREMAMRYGSDFSVYSAGSDHALTDLAVRLELRPRWLLDRADELAATTSGAVAAEIDDLPTSLMALTAVSDLERFLPRLEHRCAAVAKTIAANRRVLPGR